MRLDELDLRALLDFPPQGGVLRFGGQRVVLLEAAAFGVLRQSLISTLGMAGARALLTRFGVAHGVMTADAARRDLPWANDAEWRRAGGRLHALKGLVTLEPVERPPGPGTPPFAEALWHDSFEAEQHLALHGQADEPVCWSLVGFASGYLSRVNHREVLCVEEQCTARGDSTCRMVGRFREDWGPQIEPHLRFFEGALLDSAIPRILDDLKRVERRLVSRRRALRWSKGGEVGEEAFVARSEPMRALLDDAGRAAQLDAPVLITGEEGTGKERLARFIHERSARAAGPFVPLHCGAGEPESVERELFGYRRGAFHGATHDRAGLLAAARRGTLFLDEVDALPVRAQGRLLRVLLEGRGEPRLDLRVIAASERPLARWVSDGRFRRDLYYRLRVVELKVPPLRSRPQDVLPLARAFLAAGAARLGRRLDGFSPAAAAQLARYPWPGNARELQNVVEQAAALAGRTRIELDALPDEVRLSVPVPGVGTEQVKTLEQVEREYILAVLGRNEGHRERTAAQLGIGPATLYRKLKAYRE